MGSVPFRANDAAFETERCWTDVDGVTTKLVGWNGEEAFQFRAEWEDNQERLNSYHIYIYISHYITTGPYKVSQPLLVWNLELKS